MTVLILVLDLRTCQCQLSSVTRVRTYLVLDGHQTGSDDENVQFAESVGPLTTMIVEDVEDEDEKEDGCKRNPKKT